MAERPIFLPAPTAVELVREIPLRIVWNPGFAPVQKKKNIKALHEAAAIAGYSPILEVSTKSDEKVGQRLSAFHLTVKTRGAGDVPLECVFQGSKVFERGGPYTDLYRGEARPARRDERLQTSGRLLEFNFEGFSFPLEPKTAFYDWLYVNAIFPHREWLTRLYQYAAFTDIEFNPQRSINCQARSCALFVALMKRGLLERAVESPGAFIELLVRHAYSPRHANDRTHATLFSRS
jgi:hypothetical protein